MSFTFNELPYGASPPSTWNVVPLKHLVTLSNGYVFKSDSWEETGTPIIRIENLNGSANFNHSNLALPAKHRIFPGDLLFSWSGNPGTSFGPFRWGRVGLHYLNQHIFKVAVHGCEKDWLYWSLRAATYWIERELTSGMIGMVHVTKDELANVPIPVPPLEVQRQIAEFLDTETARMDALRQRIQRHVSSLKMRRQLQITEATRGSDSDVQRSLHAIAEVILGRQRSPQHAEGPHMVPYLRAANVKDGRLDLSDVMAMNFTSDEQRVFALRPGDVLVTEGSGSLKAVGAAAVWAGEICGTVCFQNTLLRIRPRVGLADGEFLEWWARSAFASGEFASIATGANIYHLSAERVRSLVTRFPDLDEQRRIATQLAVETRKVDDLIATRGRQLNVLAERRQALITAAVTGQFDISTASGLNVTDGVGA
ncbi:restriction endonuclease subunit S [Actinacidiphila sp. bgisy145]|uniref:restriction endonuclease subunit S n=1 Tax=Actinacidiphila sp. bgisy145 TaxID=3413792 RepID=UPI003EBCE4C7